MHVQSFSNADKLCSVALLTKKKAKNKNKTFDGKMSKEPQLEADEAVAW